MIRLKFNLLFILASGIFFSMPLFASSEKHLPYKYAVKSLTNKIYLSPSSIGQKSFTVVQFWASWCTSCSETMKRLATWSAKEAKTNIAFVSVDENIEDTKSYFNGKNRALKPLMKNVYVDTDGKFSDAVKIAGVPYILLVDRSGNILFRIYGHPTELDLEKMQNICASVKGSAA